ncbi:DUF4148 domain-containing protein [Paraburkholderia gardini]|jgi:hypothetical protein|uniref:DUF4148 domain-containing protein n=1 Tax=Paraburkholderia gardini TaxID=2823469 RepID=A0ABM8U366_9BURK|nr:DUF4148 domain-containing protein [Paraburkholderia gardini]CAG4897762.1 hypothetical protein R54767_02313 [Paraburkholderia gardini]CAG4919768.1 hypothetical protein R69919_04748 [Paraburkholderia gardini]
MKSLIKAVALAVVLAAPVVSFAQSNGPVTRAQVRAELAQLEKAGYNPNIGEIDYPENIQAAEARVAAQNSTVQNSGYGSSTNGSSQAGVRREVTVSSYSPPVYVAH